VEKEANILSEPCRQPASARHHLEWNEALNGAQEGLSKKGPGAVHITTGENRGRRKRNSQTCRLKRWCLLLPMEKMAEMKEWSDEAKEATTAKDVT